MYSEKWNEYFCHSNVCNSKEIRSILIRPCILALVHVETCITLIYILGIHEARDSQYFVKMYRWDYCFYRASNVKITIVLTLVCFFRDILVKGWKNSNILLNYIKYDGAMPFLKCMNSHRLSLSWSESGPQVAKGLGEGWPTPTSWRLASNLG